MALAYAPDEVADRVWVAQPKQREFLRAPEKEVVYGGAAGGGKTDALLIHAIRVNVKYPGAGGLFFRRSFRDLDEPGAAIPRSHELLAGIAQWRGDAHRWDFPNGSRLQFAHLDSEKSIYKYQGAQLDWLCWDELTQFKEAEYDYLRSRMRTRIPGLRTTIRAATNPGGVGHAWVKRTFIDPAPSGGSFEITDPKGQPTGRLGRFVPARVEDNQRLLEADPGYLATLEELPDALRKALRDGDWNVFDGQYFTEWRTHVHTCAPFTIPPTWTRRIVSVDFGYGAPWSCHFYVQDADLWRAERVTRWYAYHELYEKHVADEDQGKRIRALMEADVAAAKTKLGFQVIADPSMWNRKPDGHSIAEVYQDQGVPMIPANNDRVQGWQRLREYLALQADGKPALIYFNPTCKHAIETVPALVYDTTRVEDLDTEGEDHAADDARYAFQGIGPIQHSAAPTSPVVRHVRHG